jgi:signal transduction histidine kinase
VRLQLRPLPEGGAVLSLRDLSEARASQKRQEHLNHLADAAEFTQSFAHEIRNPLNAISVGVQYLAGRLTSDNPLLPDLVKIQAEAQRVSDLMNAMLAFNKPADPKFQAVGLEALLRRLLGRYAGKMQRGGVHLSFSAEDCSPVWVDPQLIERVFLNLFDNALQAMAAGGHLSLRLRTVPGASGCMVETQVCDTGPGIPPEMLSRVFTPYFTTKADGTGLGLAISKRLISLNRGAIDCTSFPVGGTIFTVTLPAHTPCQEELQD